MTDVDKIRRLEQEAMRLDKEFGEEIKKALEGVWKEHEKKIKVAAKNEFGMSTSVLHELQPNYDYMGYTLLIEVRVEGKISYNSDRRFNNEVREAIKTHVHSYLQDHIIVFIEDEEEP